MIFDNQACSLGEGLLWHPLRNSLFWFDINNKRMYERRFHNDHAQLFEFDEHVSAAGWVDQNTLLIASETALFYFSIESKKRLDIVDLEAQNNETRSNDGRADPYGGFWIGTMGKNAETGYGAIYRYYKGELRRLYADITIPNSICFSPNGRTAYYCDTPVRKIMQQTLDNEGWPLGSPEIYIDVTPYSPDGSVVDSEGNLWNAQWGANRVACYNPAGDYVKSVTFTASQISCPAFGGDEMTHLFASSARENLISPHDDDGKVFITLTDIIGQKEHQVTL